MLIISELYLPLDGEMITLQDLANVIISLTTIVLGVTIILISTGVIAYLIALLFGFAELPGCAEKLIGYGMVVI